MPQTNYSRNASTVWLEFGRTLSRLLGKDDAAGVRQALTSSVNTPDFPFRKRQTEIALAWAKLNSLQVFCEPAIVGFRVRLTAFLSSMQSWLKESSTRMEIEAQEQFAGILHVGDDLRHGNGTDFTASEAIRLFLQDSNFEPWRGKKAPRLSFEAADSWLGVMRRRCKDALQEARDSKGIPAVSPAWALGFTPQTIDKNGVLRGDTWTTDYDAAIPPWQSSRYHVVSPENVETAMPQHLAHRLIREFQPTVKTSPILFVVPVDMRVVANEVLWQTWLRCVRRYSKTLLAEHEALAKDLGLTFALVDVLLTTDLENADLQQRRQFLDQWLPYKLPVLRNWVARVFDKSKLAEHGEEALADSLGEQAISAWLGSIRNEQNTREDDAALFWVTECLLEDLLTLPTRGKIRLQKGRKARHTMVSWFGYTIEVPNAKAEVLRRLGAEGRVVGCRYQYVTELFKDLPGLEGWISAGRKLNNTTTIESKYLLGNVSVTKS